MEGAFQGLLSGVQVDAAGGERSLGGTDVGDEFGRVAVLFREALGINAGLRLIEPAQAGDEGLNAGLDPLDIDLDGADALFGALAFQRDDLFQDIFLLRHG